MRQLRKAILCGCWVFGLVLVLVVVQYAQDSVTVNGSVRNDTGMPIPAAKVSLSPTGRAGMAIETVTNSDGEFTFSLDSPGAWSLSVNADGYYPSNKPDLDIAPGITIITITMVAISTETLTINVTADGKIDVEHIELSQTLTAEHVDSIPVTKSDDLTNVIAAMPGVLKDRRNELHFYGSPSDQINWLFDGFRIDDSATGQLGASIGVETVESVNLLSGRYSVKYGKGSGGAFTIDPKTGTDNPCEASLTKIFRTCVPLKFNFTNFLPGIEFIRGLSLTSWKPQFNISGPIKSGRVWFFNGTSVDYGKNIYIELPKGQDSNSFFQLSNVTKVQANITKTQTLTAGLLLNRGSSDLGGLSLLNPPETTVNNRSHRSFFYVKDQIALRKNALIEFGYGSYRSYAHDMPQGHGGLYQIFPYGSRGYYHSDVENRSGRDQLMVKAFLPPVRLLGTHQLETGADTSRSTYAQNSIRTGYEHHRLDGSTSMKVLFGGNSVFRATGTEQSVYFQDRWSIWPWLFAEAGIRFDREGYIGKSATTARFNTAILPPGLSSTKFSAGWGLVPEKANLGLFARNLGYYAIYERPTVLSPFTPPPRNFLSLFAMDPSRLRMPSLRNLSFGFEQNLPRSFYLQVNWLHKRGKNGYAYKGIYGEDAARYIPAGLPPGSDIAVNMLLNKKVESYDSAEISLSKKFWQKYDWFVSYSRSRAFSNAALDPYVDDPLIYTDVAGRMPTDAPNRLVSWGMIPLGKRGTPVPDRKHTISYFLEFRDGFPFTAFNDEGWQVGELNSWRLPRYFSVNVRYERKFGMAGHKWLLRIGIDNLTNRSNHTLVNANTSSPDFLKPYGIQPRKLVLNIRWLGHR